MVTVPMRCAPLFEAIVMVTVPVPVPLDPELTMIQGAPLAAVHAQLVAGRDARARRLAAGRR